MLRLVRMYFFHPIFFSQVQAGAGQQRGGAGGGGERRGRDPDHRPRGAEVLRDQEGEESMVDRGPPHCPGEYNNNHP